MRVNHRTIPTVLALLVLLASLVTASLARPSTARAAAPSSLYTLRFDDEFNGNAVDTSVWNYRTDVRGNSAQRPQNVSESGGSMNIALKAENYNGKSFTGGGLISKQKFRYGYYETRMKLNTGPGWHSAFWSMCGDGSGVSGDCRQTEIDGFEIDSASPRNIRANIFDWPAGGGETTTNPYDMGFDSSAGWHTYGFDYDETGIRVYLDGALSKSLTYTANLHTEDWMNIWLTTVAFNNTPDAAQLPATVSWDYIRYYQKSYYVDNDGPSNVDYSESGPGWSGSGLAGFSHSSSRYTCTAGAKASWKFTPPADGTYRVDAWDIVDGGSDAAGSYTVSPAGIGPKVINGRTGSSDWVTLGTSQLAAGTSQTVTATASGAGCLRADSVRFVRVA